MCGRFVLGESSWAEYHDALSIIRPEPARVSYNIKPTQFVPVVTGRPGELASSDARWWFVPHWHKGGVKDWKATTFNARIESAASSPTFRVAWRSNRCLVPATGYYEWTGPKGKKRPHLIYLERNDPVFFFAGLHSTLSDGTETCTIVTREAEPEIAHIHNRMPVILSDEELMPWLAFEDRDWGTSWTGRFLVRDVRPFGRDDDGPELIEEIDQELF